jgi:hypothetical protein
MDERIENSMDAGEAIAQAISEAEDTIAGVKEVTHGMVLSVSGKALGPVAEADAAAGLLNLQQAEDFIAEASDLLEKGADTSLKTDEGDTALTLAEKNGHDKIIELIQGFGG